MMRFQVFADVVEGFVHIVGKLKQLEFAFVNEMCIRDRDAGCRAGGTRRGPECLVLDKASSEKHIRISLWRVRNDGLHNSSISVVGNRGAHLEPKARGLVHAQGHANHAIDGGHTRASGRARDPG